jgi:hypothetical protein
MRVNLAIAPLLATTNGRNLVARFFTTIQRSHVTKKESHDSNPKVTASRTTQITTRQGQTLHHPDNGTQAYQAITDSPTATNTKRKHTHNKADKPLKRHN